MISHRQLIRTHKYGFGSRHAPIRGYIDTADREQLIGIDAIVRRHRNTDADVRQDMVSLHIVRRHDLVAQPQRKRRGVGRSFKAGLQNGEFVAAQPRDRVGLAQALPHARCNRTQQCVADRVTERVVDALEVVDIEIKNSEMLTALHA